MIPLPLDLIDIVSWNESQPSVHKARRLFGAVAIQHVLKELGFKIWSNS